VLERRGPKDNWELEMKSGLSSVAEKAILQAVLELDHEATLQAIVQRGHELFPYTHKCDIRAGVKILLGQGKLRRGAKGRYRLP